MPDENAVVTETPATPEVVAEPEIKPDAQAAPETPEPVKTDAEDAPPEEPAEVPESPEAAYWRGRAEAAEELARGGKPDDVKPSEKLHVEIQDLVAKRKAIVVDEYDEGAALAKKIAERNALSEEIDAKREAREDARRAESEVSDSQVTYDGLTDEALKAEKLPTSLRNELQRRVGEKLRAKHPNGGKPSDAEVELALEGEAAKLRAARPAPAAPRRATPAAPAAGARRSGAASVGAAAVREGGSRSDTLADMRKAGLIP
jgi:hypothetical protein